ncbi:DUF4238 domain-containing protein [Streptomyces sp. NBC_01142]|uniref:DUF4238 domain-containing protein n=1 Tax=Streptomyces sp. NBC_01142 TaxID=2975865 RepID=UPI0022541396|nr:DUF4238 domain-containing protein [Streptomyces sp. NBC_01142]MCX4826751.1 DUF4238 domain-containing protein [Streptomyces sp. NBC_01142]
MSKPKKHHYVPQMYLRNFADADNRTQVVRLAQQTSNTARINTIAAENHFHRFTVDGEETLYVEEIATKIEGRAAQPLLRLIDPQKRRWPLPNDDRLSLAFFIAFQFMRVPVARDLYASMVAQLPDILGLTFPAEFEDLDVPLLHGASMVSEALPEGAAALCNRAWTILDFKLKTLATSDVPVVVLPDEGVTPRTAAGFMSPGGMYLPLARRTALFIGPPGTSPEGDRMMRGNALLARLFNSATVQWARDCIFHHPEDDPLHGIELPGPRRGEVRWEGMGHPGA